MRLLANWRRVLRKAWSIRLMLVAGLLSGAEVILPMFVEAIPRSLFAGLSMLTVSGAFIARLVAQQDIDNG